ncbi:hypothetical protein CIK05_14700 [Bdellovibrio sp. qaytius]|nr:hypothetical protein CIK05_14700 [Bdellovibrio sp. qaytius]
MQKQKPNYRPIIFTVFLCLVAAAGLYYFTKDDAPATVSQIKTSYFQSNAEFAETIEKHLTAEIGKQKYFWLGYEADNEVQFDLTNLLKQQIEKQNGPFDIVIIDQELMLTEEQEKVFAKTHRIPLKENFAEAAELIKANKDKRILVITAAVYSSNFILSNPHGKINELTNLKPLVFSLGFFPVANKEERQTLFKCDTEDKTGTAPWACAVINKARVVRRKVDLEKLNGATPLRVGLMDSTGDVDYMVLVGK